MMPSMTADLLYGAAKQGFEGGIFVGLRMLFSDPIFKDLIFRFSQTVDSVLSTKCERTRMSEVTSGGRPEDY